MEKKFFVLIAFIFVSYLGIGQEFRCNIQVVSSQIQGTNKQVFQTLQNELYEFMNNTGQIIFIRMKNELIAI